MTVQFPSNIPSVLDSLVTQLQGANEEGLVSMVEQMQTMLGSLRSNEDLPQISWILRLISITLIRLDLAEDAVRFALQALRGFALVGDELSYEETFISICEAFVSETEPYPHRLDFLDDVRARLRVMLRRWIDISRPNSGGNDSSLFVSDDEIRRFLDGDVLAAGYEAFAAPQPDAPEMMQAALAARLQLSDRLKVDIPLLRLKNRLGLSELEVWLILILFMGQTDPFIRRVYSYAWNDLTQKDPDIPFLCGMLFGPPQPIWSLVHRMLAPNSPLMTFHLVEVNSDEGRVRLTESTIRNLQGIAGFDPQLTEWVDHLAPPDNQECGSEPELDHLINSWGKNREKLRKEPLRLILRGATVGDRRRAVALAAIKSNMKVAKADLGIIRYRKYDELLMSLGMLAREARLGDLIVLMEIPSAPVDEVQQGQSSSLEPALQRGLELFEGLVILSLEHNSESYVPHIRSALELEIPILSVADQIETWSTMLKHHGLPNPGNFQLKSIIQRYPLGASSIDEAVKEIWINSVLKEEPPNTEIILNVAGRKVRQAMSSIAQRVARTLTWADIILPAETMELLQEMITFARYRTTVMDKWGFRKKLPYGRALSSLFWGPPGTGKTMMAGIIAAELGMELFRIDLSQVVSKYIGETEKNLARAFDEATRNKAVLLFDEADSLFSKRTEVKSSNDRYANLEVNFLLQRMEEFEGVTILTTNFESSIDDAFKRRIRFKVPFPFPDADLRTELWKLMLPPEAEVEDDIDYEFLAEKFEMSGGGIKNAVLRAAFTAAEKGKKIGYDEMFDAASREYQELGRLLIKEEF